MIALPLIITITCYYYARHGSKQKGVNALNSIKWKLMNFKKSALKFVRVIISMS